MLNIPGQRNQIAGIPLEPSATNRVMETHAAPRETNSGTVKRRSDWAIRSQAPKSPLSWDTEKVQRLDDFGFAGA